MARCEHDRPEQGNEGVAGQVRQTSGAIGYVELAYAIENKMTTAQLENKSGKVALLHGVDRARRCGDEGERDCDGLLDRRPLGRQRVSDRGLHVGLHLSEPGRQGTRQIGPRCSELGYRWTKRKRSRGPLIMFHFRKRCKKPRKKALAEVKV